MNEVCTRWIKFRGRQIRRSGTDGGYLNSANDTPETHAYLSHNIICYLTATCKHPPTKPPLPLNQPRPKAFIPRPPLTPILAPRNISTSARRTSPEALSGSIRIHTRAILPSQSAAFAPRIARIDAHTIIPGDPALPVRAARGR